MANPMGKAIFSIARLLTSSCRGFLCESVVSNLGNLWRNYFIIAQFRNVMLQSSIHIASENEINVVPAESMLLLQLGNNYIGYCITDHHRKQISSWVVYNFSGDTQEAISALVEKHPILKASFTAAYFLHDTPVSTILPNDFSGKPLAESMLKLNRGDFQGMTIMHQMLPNQNNDFYFAIPENVYRFINEQFSDIKHEHLHALWLRNDTSLNITFRVVFLYQQVHIYVQRDGLCLLMQQYAFETPEDALYHILNIAQHLKISLQDCTMELEGMIDENSALSIKLNQYIPNLRWNHPDNDRFSSSAHEYPAAFLAFQERIISCVL